MSGGAISNERGPLPNLDLLRATAVTLVLVDHVLLARNLTHWGWLAYGSIGLFGVYLFFLHTSLVLMWSLERRPDPLDFYIRRIFRIYPLAIAAILLAAFTHAPVAGHAGQFFVATPWHWRGLVLNCLLVYDLFGNAPLIHGVTWSLPPEVDMYVLLPCLFFMARSVRRVWPLVLLWALAAAFAFRVFPVSVGNNFPVVIPDFLAGVIAYVGFMRRRPVLPAWCLLPLLAVLFLVDMRVHRLRADWYLLLLLGLVLPSIRQFRAQLPARLVHLVARYSYGVYLMHPFALVLGMKLLATRALAVQLTVVFACTAVMAVAVYHLLERPMIVLGARLAAQLAGKRRVPSPQSLENLEPAP